MGFSITNADGNVTSKIFFWGGMDIDVMTITQVEDMDPGDTSVLVMTEKTTEDGMLEFRANAIEMGSPELACQVHALAMKYLMENIART